jgi:outer membrane protein assembly factor BamA
MVSSTPRMKKYVLTVLSLLALASVFAQDFGAEKKPRRFFAIPIAGYSNETNVMFGGLVYYTYRPENRPYTLEPDMHYINSIFSLNKQVKVAVRSNFFLSDEKYFLSPGIEYELWPSSFYGIGNNTNSGNAEDFTKNQFSFKTTLIRRFNDDLALGAIVEYNNYRLSKLDEDGVLQEGIISGSEPYQLNKLGLMASYDTRDMAGYPTEGCYHQVSVKRAAKIIDGDYSYTKYVLDLRRFFNPVANHVLAFQGYLSHIDNTAPYQKLGDLGAEIRGYESGRFIDKTFLMMRSEYRFFPFHGGKIMSRLGFVTFIESGQVASSISSLKLSETKFSAGAGLRITLLPSEKLNLRIDYGIGKNYADIVITTYEIF